MDRAKIYSEVIEVLDHLVEEDYNKIPKDYIDYFNKNSDKNYKFKYDSLKSFNEQPICNETKTILFGLYSEFVADERQKKKINTYLHEYNSRIECEKQRRYNDNDWLNKEQDENHEGNIELIQIGKEKFVDKIKRAIRNILKKRK